MVTDSSNPEGVDEGDEGGASAGLTVFLVIFFLALAIGIAYSVYRYKKDRDCWNKLKYRCKESKLGKKLLCCKCCGARKQRSIIRPKVRADLEDNGFDDDLPSF